MSVDPAHDRLGHLLSGEAPPSYNGIDFVEVSDLDPTQLRVHFLNTAAVRGTFSATPPVTICGAGSSGPLTVLGIDESESWSADEAGRPVLGVTVAQTGDAASYSLTIYSTALDPYFDAASFSFPSALTGSQDCQPPAPSSPPDTATAVPVTYLAKDFQTFRQALLDYSALAYPLWVERSEADLGVVLLEALSAIADELSYLQDRVAAEAILATATQRLSLVHHAHLVDYDPTPAIAATTTLQFDVAPTVTSLSGGLRCSAAGPDGQRVGFEVGAGLADTNTGELLSPAYVVDSRWNAGPSENRNLLPYWWDLSRQVLPAGSQRLWIIGHGHAFAPGQQLLLDTAAELTADPPIREILTVGAVLETSDAVFGVDLTRVDLQAPTTLDHDLGLTHLAGNLLPAMQGVRAHETFAVPDGVVVRTAANWTPTDPRPDYRYTLGAQQISWLPEDSTAYQPALSPPAGVTAVASASGGALPSGTYAYQVTAVNTNGETTAPAAATVAVTGPHGSVAVTWKPVLAAVTYTVYGRTAGSSTKLAQAGPFAPGVTPTYVDTGAAAPGPESPPAVNTTAGPGPMSAGGDLSAEVAAVPQIALATAAGQPWRWQRWLLGSAPADAVFTLTPEHYSFVGGTGSTTWFDYDGEGTTIRFGDGTFGLTPADGSEFAVTYLAGGGVTGNVPADTIVQVDPSDPQQGLVLAVTNPFAATGGADEETADQIRDRAPEAFRAKPLRVVLADDYVQAAQSLPWVMQAGTSFRWTGSWLTVFTTANPSVSETLTASQIEQLSDLLDRRRLAGYESYVLAPSYVSLDLEITVTAQPTAFAADVQAAVIANLRPGVLPDGSVGFFDHSKWSFGQPLESSALLAAIERAAGVLGVTSVLYRRRGLDSGFNYLTESVPIPADQILRVDDDPSAPDAGALNVTVELAS